MDYIFALATLGVAGFALCWLLHLIWLGYEWIAKKQKPTVNDSFIFRSNHDLPTASKKVKWSLVIIAALSLFLYDDVTFRELVGIHTIKDLNSGTHCYYVEVSNSAREYVLPGKISISVDTDDDEHVRYYYIESVYFSNGEYLDFTRYGNNYVTNINRSVRLSDQNGNDWSCKILDEHAYCPQIVETSYVSTKSIIVLLFTIVAVLYNWLGYITWENKQS